MKEKYQSLGLNYDLIISKYPDINEYEHIVNFYLDDAFFDEINELLEYEDYELAKDALKGLYILASDLCLYPLYIALLEIYEDIEDENYKEVLTHYQEMMKIHKKLRGGFVC